MVEERVKAFLDEFLEDSEKYTLVKLAVFGGSFDSLGMEFVTEVDLLFFFF